MWLCNRLSGRRCIVWKILHSSLYIFSTMMNCRVECHCIFLTFFVLFVHTFMQITLLFKWIHTLWNILSFNHHVDRFKLLFDPLRPSDAVCRQRSGRRYAQVMACCLKQCWFRISEAQRYSPESNCTVSVQASIRHNEFGNHTFKNYYQISRVTLCLKCIDVYTR